MEQLREKEMERNSLKHISIVQAAIILVTTQVMAIRGLPDKEGNGRT